MPRSTKSGKKVKSRGKGKRTGVRGVIADIKGVISRPSKRDKDIDDAVTAAHGSLQERDIP